MLVAIPNAMSEPTLYQYVHHAVLISSLCRARCARYAGSSLHRRIWHWDVAEVVLADCSDRICV